MAVSIALENSAKEFNIKYACNFDFATFDLHVDEFTFLRPNGGWIDVYKKTFANMYAKSLELVSLGSLDNLSGEAMLDDFEYTLIRPYVNETEKDIKHKHYVGMDRMARIDYVAQLTVNAPKNQFELFVKKYKSGELTIRKIKAEFDPANAEVEEYVKILACAQALENVNKGRSAIWRSLHPFKNNTEKRYAVLLRRGLIEHIKDGEELYGEISAAAHETFEGYKRAGANLSQSMVQAREELTRRQKMNDAMRDSFTISTNQIQVS